MTTSAPTSSWPLASPAEPVRVTRAEYGEQQVRALALSEAISYFAYARRQDPAAAPVGALVVLGMADHFADYITSGAHPEATS